MIFISFAWVVSGMSETDSDSISGTDSGKDSVEDSGTDSGADSVEDSGVASGEDSGVASGDDSGEESAGDDSLGPLSMGAHEAIDNEQRQNIKDKNKQMIFVI